jgi:hypothetical protein
MRNRAHRHPRDPFRRSAGRGPQRRLQPRGRLYGAARGHRRSRRPREPAQVGRRAKC